MAPLQGQFYAHTAVDKDLKHCPPPQRLDGQQSPSTAPVRLSTGANRTLASRTDVVVCEPPRWLGAAPADSAPRKLEARPVPLAAPPPVRATPPTPDPALAAAAPPPLARVAPPPPARVTAPPPPVCKPSAAAPPAPALEPVVAEAPSPPPPAAPLTASVSTPPPGAVVEAIADGLVVTLGPFTGVDRASDLYLTAHADELVVAGAALDRTLRVALGRRVDPTRVKAKWVRRDRKLRVELKVATV